jgi:hypothetical protein
MFLITPCPPFHGLSGAKLISGTVSGTSVLLDPKGSATRAQVAAMLMQFVHHIAET